MVTKLSYLMEYNRDIMQLACRDILAKGGVVSAGPSRSVCHSDSLRSLRAGSVEESLALKIAR